VQKTQLTLQKITVFGSIVLASLMIVYALGFSTNIFNLMYHSDPDSRLFYVPGAELYLEAQPFNRLLFSHALALFAVCITMFVTLTHRRRLYYISNYITSLAFAGYAVYVGNMMLGKAAEYKGRYLEVDFERLLAVTERFRMNYSDSTFMLDTGMVMSVLLMVFAGLLVVNLVLKTIWMSREKWLDEPAEVR